MTHAQRILKALQRGQKLTPLDILRRFGCYRASARIADLRAQGHKIKTERHKTRTGAVVARYSLMVVMVAVVGCADVDSRDESYIGADLSMMQIVQVRGCSYLSSSRGGIEHLANCPNHDSTGRALR